MKNTFKKNNSETSYNKTTPENQKHLILDQKGLLKLLQDQAYVPEEKLSDG